MKTKDLPVDRTGLAILMVSVLGGVVMVAAFGPHATDEGPGILHAVAGLLTGVAAIAVIAGIVIGLDLMFRRDG